MNAVLPDYKNACSEVVSDFLFFAELHPKPHDLFQNAFKTSSLLESLHRPWPDKTCLILRAFPVLFYPRTFFFFFFWSHVVSFSIKFPRSLTQNIIFFPIVSQSFLILPVRRNLRDTWHSKFSWCTSAMIVQSFSTVLYLFFWVLSQQLNWSYLRNWWYLNYIICNYNLWWVINIYWLNEWKRVIVLQFLSATER